MNLPVVDFPFFILCPAELNAFFISSKQTYQDYDNDNEESF